MAEKELKWLHSHGWDNKDPNYDLGGDPSKFEIAVLPANNLFDDVTPEQAKEGLIDWRCFYIANKYQDTNYHVELKLNPATCTDVTFGSVVRNDVQKLTFQGADPTDDGGYFIIQMNWGPELVVYWNNSYAAMAANMESQIRKVKYHGGVTVVATGSTFAVTFDGDLKNRRMGLIKIIQNNLVQSANNEYRVDNLSNNAFANGCNYAGQMKVQVERDIVGAPDEGVIHIPYPTNDTNDPSSWVYMHLSYNSYSGRIFNLTTPIPLNIGPGFQPPLGNNDEVWVDMPSPQPVNTVNVTKVAEGSPINQLASIIEKDTDDPPDYSDQGDTFDVGLLKPLESFFVWVRREVSSGQNGCKDDFSIELTGTAV